MEIVYIDHDTIQHHGIKGQRWGIRRFQNYDGSYTADGASRYGVKVKYSTTNDRDHSESKLSDRTKTNLATLAINAATLNPVGVAKSVFRLTKQGIDSVSAQRRTSKVDSQNTNGNIDSKTGFHLKEKRDYSTKEDVAAVNPGFKNFDANTKNNCMLCTLTYDLRQRGYAVSANKASRGYLVDDFKHWYPKAQVCNIPHPNRPETIKTFKDVFNRTHATKDYDYAVRAIETIEKQGSGTRGNLMVLWNSGGGHSMAYEVDNNGKMRILECQANKIITNPEKILSRCYNIKFARLDNIEPNLDYVKEIAH